MGKPELGLTILVFLPILAFYLYERFVPIRRERLREQKYPLYAIRHQLVMLVAQGVISEDDEVFQWLYSGVNNVIPKLDCVNSNKALVYALLSQRVVESRKLTRIWKQLEESPEEVRQITKEFFRMISLILLQRAVLVRLFGGMFYAGKQLAKYLPTSTVARFGHVVMGALYTVFKTEGKAFQIKRDVDRMAMSLGS